jgi:glucuronoarabinoxylan endo-1,4-beta-xylanase
MTDKGSRFRLWLWAWRSLPFVFLGCAFGCMLGSCARDTDPLYGSQTNWYRSCKTPLDCENGLECLCGTCTRRCDTMSECENLASAACLTASYDAVVELCSGEASAVSMCLVPCPGAPCPTGTTCSAGACVPRDSVEAQVSIDLDTRYQTLVGFGASFAYCEDEMVAHPRKGALFDALFTDSGFEVLRMGNRYEAGQESVLARTGQLVSAAIERMEPDPVLLLTSGSPPASFKANGSRACSGNPDSCTLLRLEDGGFDYEGLADFWRDTLVQYGQVGVYPTYLSIQNNPDWVPSSSVSADACHFLPREGTETVDVGGETQTLSFPGYEEALSAVVANIATLEPAPSLLGPETSSLTAALAYTPGFDPSSLAALAIHLYSSEPTLPDVASFEAVLAMADDQKLPVFQTEMAAEGLETAVLAHRALTEANAAMYLQNDFISSATALEKNTRALVQLTDDDFVLQAPYYALKHYAFASDGGDVRVAAEVEGREALVSAWLRPDGERLTLVALNQGAKAIRLRLEAAEFLSGFASSRVFRTNFASGEFWASLGSFPTEGSVELPASSILTIALEK